VAKINRLGKYRLADHTFFELVITAAFIAVVSFGAIGGVLIAAAPLTFFGLAANVVCPRDTVMGYDEWYDGESTQFTMYCENTATSETRDRTLAALAVLMAADYLIIFWGVWLVLIILRAAQRAKRAKQESPPQNPQIR
jgi:hypothetical protein